MNVKEESEKAGLKLNVQKTKIMASCYHSMANRWGNNGNSVYFLGLQNHCKDIPLLTKVHLVKSMVF